MLAAALLSLVTLVSGAPDPAAAAPPAAIAPANDALNAALAGIARAADPAEVLAAYASAMRIDRTDARVHGAYVHRMVELGMPEQALNAAQLVLANDPADELARAVLAYSAARRGDMINALNEIALAAGRGNDHPFIQRSAGQLLAWYDSVPTRPPLAESVQKMLAKEKAAFAAKEEFAAAYKDAMTGYQQQAAAMAQAQAALAAPTTQPAAPAPAPVVRAAPPAVAPAAVMPAAPAPAPAPGNVPVGVAQPVAATGASMFDPGAAAQPTAVYMPAPQPPTTVYVQSPPQQVIYQPVYQPVVVRPVYGPPPIWCEPSFIIIGDVRFHHHR